jgi:hypothetical protein
MRPIPLAALGLALAPALFSASRAEAIPAFARKYGTSCSTCHVAFPKLNDFGEAFRRNAFQVPQDDEFYVKDAPVALGAQAWKEEFPNAIWPGDIPHLPPISFLTRLSIEWGSEEDVKGDFDFPTYFNFLFGGTFGPDIGFFAHTGPSTRLYLRTANVLDDELGERALNATIGLVEPAYAPLSNARRLTITPYLYADYTVTTPNGNGNDFQLDRQRAIEIDGVIASRASWAIGVTNGTNDASDNNSNKDVYYRVAGKLGGIAFDGTGGAVEGDSLAQTENWTDNSITVGHSGYFGKSTPSDVSTGDDYSIDFYRLIFDVRGNSGDLDVTAGVVLGSDDNAGNDDVRVGSEVYFLEAQYVIYPWLIALARGEWLEFDLPGGDDSLDSSEVRRLVISATALVRANLKFIVEGRFDDGGGDRQGGEALLLALDFSF